MRDFVPLLIGLPVVCGLCLWAGARLLRRLRLLGVRVGSLVKQGTITPIARHYSDRVDNKTPQVNEHGQTQLLFPLD